MVYNLFYSSFNVSFGYICSIRFLFAIRTIFTSKIIQFESRGTLAQFKSTPVILYGRTAMYENVYDKLSFLF